MCRWIILIYKIVFCEGFSALFWSVKPKFRLVCLVKFEVKLKLEMLFKMTQA